MKDLLVECNSPEGLDKIVNQFSAALVQISPTQYAQHNGAYIVRCFGDPGFIKFMINNQGYGKVIGELSTLI